MKFFATITQHRILRFYWNTKEPFTVCDLVSRGLFHSLTAGRVSLFVMELHGQILPFAVVDGQTQYIGTTESKEEWIQIRGWSREYGYIDALRYHRNRLNRYERHFLLTQLEKMLEEYRQAI